MKETERQLMVRMLAFFFQAINPKLDLAYQTLSFGLIHHHLSDLFRHPDGQGPSGSKPSASTSLIHENDLAVSFSDLDKIFNSDEDELAVSASVHVC